MAKTKTEAANEDWTGTIFANNWILTKKLNGKQSIEYGCSGNNAHYLATNQNCGVDNIPMERSSLKRIIEDKVPVLFKCKNCINGSKKENGTCDYLNKKNNTKKINKTPNRQQEIKIGDIINNQFEVINTITSGNTLDHHCRAKVKCIKCGTILPKEYRFDVLRDGLISHICK